MHRILLMIIAVSACKGGAITSGSLDFGFGTGNSAFLSGENFQATIIDLDYFTSGAGNGFVPFTPPIPQGGYGVGVGSAGHGSGITYKGVFYYPISYNLPNASPYASLVYSTTLTSQVPLITGPGEYPVSFSVQLNFCLSDPTGSIAMSYCESDAGIATGAYDYIPGYAAFETVFPYNFVSLANYGLTLTVTTPEPSTRSSAGIAVCLGFFVAIIARKESQLGMYQ